jgi:hypothetical protein
MAMFTCPWCQAHEEPVPNPNVKKSQTMSGWRNLNPWACPKCGGAGGWEDFDSETDQERIARWEACGDLDPNCDFCRREFYDQPQPVGQRVELPFMPRHKAMPHCRSGKHDHCTCDTCF